ncbi:hypothetical protein RTBOTA2_001206 [Rhodotorula toruloides]|uniref:Uncharacterized protein n=1 Tax=Rhodotorula toruloides TaxID=5286 RepID=A0A2T0A511_RHOTO|nr:hypothetical protein RTBOTA2_001206 [Rhodotorula toruloides]PRQ73083.1 hypothetical protein AAT19DRAFT_15836 [Rhodotorula toruloides]
MRYGNWMDTHADLLLSTLSPVLALLALVLTQATSVSLLLCIVALLAFWTSMHSATGEYEKESPARWSSYASLFTSALVNAFHVLSALANILYGSDESAPSATGSQARQAWMVLFLTPCICALALFSALGCEFSCDEVDPLERIHMLALAPFPPVPPRLGDREKRGRSSYQDEVDMLEAGRKPCRHLWDSTCQCRSTDTPLSAFTSSRLNSYEQSARSRPCQQAAPAHSPPPPPYSSSSRA